MKFSSFKDLRLSFTILSPIPNSLASENTFCENTLLVVEVRREIIFLTVSLKSFTSFHPVKIPSARKFKNIYLQREI